MEALEIGIAFLGLLAAGGITVAFLRAILSGSERTNLDMNRLLRRQDKDP